MNILIVGAGIVGTTLAQQLSQEGHRVVILDRKRSRIEEVGENLDVLAVTGYGGLSGDLEKAGIDDADMVIAVTDTDEVNFVVGWIAQVHGVKQRFIRIRNQEYMKSKKVVPLTEMGAEYVINPETLIIKALVRTIEIPGSTSAGTLAEGQVLLLGFDIEKNSPVAGLTIAEFKRDVNIDSILVFYIIRDDRVIAPTGRDTIEPGDHLHLLVPSSVAQDLPAIFTRQPHQMKYVIISGASRIGVQLAEALEGRVNKITLIEQRRELAEEIAQHLKKTTVLQGAETSLDVLREASIDQCDLFCALSDDEERNMLTALIAKKYGAYKVAVLVEQFEYVSVMNSLGVKAVISPRMVTVSEILTYIRKGHVNSVIRLPESQGEIMEIEAVQGCGAVKAPLSRLKFPPGALVGAIIRDGKMKIPTGDDRIAPGEKAVLFAVPKAIPGIEKLFSPRKWF